MPHLYKQVASWLSALGWKSKSVFFVFVSSDVLSSKLDRIVNKRNGLKSNLKTIIQFLFIISRNSNENTVNMFKS